MLLIGGILESVRTLKDKTLKITFETNEPNPEQFMGIASSVQQFGFIAFKNDPFTSNEKKEIEALEASYEDNQKTHSQRLRGVLYRLWEQQNEGYQDFDSFYKFKMESLINHFKSKLEQ